MKHRSFSLMPFSAAGIPPGIEITGSAGRDTGKLTIRYELRGPLKQLVIPAPADTSARMDRLWENTCFEFFIGPENSDYYWEFNLAPSGHWNVYRFTSYRQEMQEEQAFASLPFSVEARTDVLTLILETDLGAVVPIDRTSCVGISAVVKLADGTLTYWALSHPGPQPDFHRRDGVIFEL